MVDEARMRQLSDEILPYCLEWDSFYHRKGMNAYTYSLFSDVQDFILIYADDPLRLKKKIEEILPIFAHQPKSEKNFFKKLSESKAAFQELNAHVPMLIQYSKYDWKHTDPNSASHKSLVKNYPYLGVNLTEWLYEFFDLLGQWILEVDRSPSYEARKEKLERTMQVIRDYINK